MRKEASPPPPAYEKGDSYYITGLRGFRQLITNEIESLEALRDRNLTPGREAYRDSTMIALRKVVLQLDIIFPEAKPAPEATPSPAGEALSQA